MRMMRCLAQLSISAGGRTEHLWPGLEVNVERELAPGYTLADAVAGREDCFEDVHITVDGGPAPEGFETPMISPDVDLSTAVIRPKTLKTRSRGRVPAQE